MITNNGTTRTTDTTTRYMMVMPVFRFKLSGDMVDAILQFSKMHQHDDRETYKEAWIVWKRDAAISKMFETEIERLQTLGYKGNAANIEDKIFKSGRYYFRTKIVNNDHNAATAAAATPSSKRGKYIPMSKQLISDMDDHISRYYKRENSENNYKPSELFNDFCSSHTDVLNHEIERLVLFHASSSFYCGVGAGVSYDVAGKILVRSYSRSQVSQMATKIKKTYKNRIFKFCSHLN